MVISKCVPIAISRKQFSDFLINHEKQENMFLVGYKKYDDDKRVNIRMPFEKVTEIIRDDVIDYIKENGGIIVPPEDNPQSEGVIPVKVSEIGAYPISVTIDEEGQIVKGETWQDITDGDGQVVGQTNILDLAKRQGFVEINAGGDYIEDFLLFANPVEGTITNVVVDNTGLPLGNDEYISPKEGDEGYFTLYYGYQSDDMSGCYEILTVPPMCRGIAQIMHTKDSKLDIVIHASYSYALDAENKDITKFIQDYKTEEELENEPTNDPEDFTPTAHTNEYDIDMAEKKGYIEFIPNGAETYTFWFSNPEIGSSTYIVIDNVDEHYKGDISIWYGKRMKPDDPTDDIKYEVTTVENERCVIEVFHSLSADIIVKITKV